MKTFNLEAAEREAITRALRETRGHVTNTAKLLGVSRPGLYEKLKKHNLDAQSFRAKAAVKS